MGNWQIAQEIDLDDFLWVAVSSIIMHSSLSIGGAIYFL